MPADWARGHDVVLMGQDGPSTRAIYRALSARYPDVAVIIEPPVPKRELIRRRLRRLGTRTVVGQILFMTLVLPLLKRRGRHRVQEIEREHGLDSSRLDGVEIVRVPSVNSDEARAALVRTSPRVVVVSGTRIIGTKTLRSVPATFINMHAGITPLYRGVHGGYWALAEGRPELAGTTVHLVDEGIDTGTILGQATFDTGAADTFATYPYLHTAAGLPVLMEAVGHVLNGGPNPIKPPDLPSQLRSHPTLWGYLRTRVRAGVK